MIKLIAMLGAGIPAVIGVILEWIGRKFGTATATVALFVFLTVAFITCIRIILETVLSVIQIPAWITNSVGLFVPTDFIAVLSAIVSAKVCRAAYDLAMGKAKAFNSAT